MGARPYAGEQQGDRMNRHRGLIRSLMFCSWGLIILAAFFTNMDGVFGLDIRSSRVLVLSLWVTCCASAILTIVYDRAARFVAVVVLFSLVVLFLPTL